MNDSNRILALFNDIKTINNKYFMPFLVCGDPSIEQFTLLVKKIDPYIDILELGIPFSDPIADGPTVQEANMRAFEVGINTKVALDTIKNIRTFFSKPIVILTYYNILIQGSDTIESSLDKTLKSFKESGIDGIVIADLPIEEAGLALKYCKKHNISLIFLIAPTTTEERLEKILKEAQGFVYLISILGVTGAREQVAQITKETIKRVKEKIKTEIPVFLGFGISKPEHASTLAELGADGIIIGSAIIDVIKRNLANFDTMEKELVEFVSSIKNALK